MARQARYEDYVSYDPEPVEEEDLAPEVYAARTARHIETLRVLSEEAEARRQAVIAKAAMFMTGVAA